MSQSPNDLVLTIKSRADDASFSATGQQVRDRMVKMQEETSSALRTHIEKLDETFGRSSTFGHSLHALGGGGALFGFGELGRMIDESSKKMMELSEKYTEGKINAGDMVDQVARGLPLIGAFYDATRNLSDAFSGAAEQAEQLKKMAEEAAHFRQVEWEAMAKQAELQLRLSDSIRASRNAQANTYLEGPSAQIAHLQQGIEDRAIDFKAQKRKLEKDNDVDRLTAEVAKRKDEIAQLNKEHEEVAKRVAANDPAVRAAYGAGYDTRERTKDEQREESLRKQLVILNGQQDAQQKRLKSVKDTVDQFDTDRQAKDLAAQAEIDKLREQRAKERETRTRESEQRINDIYAKSTEERLRLEHHYYEADLVRLKADLNKRVEALAVATRDNLIKTARDNTLSIPQRIAQGGSDLSGSIREAFAMFRGFGTDTDAAKKSDAKQRFADLLQADQERAALLRQRIDDLGREVELGNKAAEVERDRLQIAEQFNQRRLELQRILHSDQADLGTKLRAFGQYFQSFGQEAAAQHGRLDQSLAGNLRGAIEQMAGQNPALARQLRQHDIKKQYSDKAAQLQAIIKDPNATAAERAQAAEALKMLPGIEQGELAAAAKSGMNFDTSVHAIMNTGGRLTGANIAAHEQAFLAQHGAGDKSREQIDKFEKMINLLDQIEKRLADIASIGRRPPAPIVY